MEWLVGAEGANEVDIGYCSQLKIKSVGASYEFVETGDLIEPKTFPLSKYKWTEEITMDKAISLLDKDFNPFKQVSHLSLSLWSNSWCTVGTLLIILRRH